MRNSESNQLLDRDHFQAMNLAEVNKVGHARHSPVVIHNFADHTGWGKASEACEVDSSLCLPASYEHAAGLRTQWKHVSWTREIGWPRCWVNCAQDCRSAIICGYAGCNATT